MTIELFEHTRFRGEAEGNSETHLVYIDVIREQLPKCSTE
jgi:hypothetical protein